MKYFVTVTIETDGPPDMARGVVEDALADAMDRNEEDQTSSHPWSFDVSRQVIS